MRALVLVFALVSVGLLAGSAIALGLAPHRGAAPSTSSSVTMVRPLSIVALDTSHVYAGYAVAAAKNVSSIQASWKIPTVQGSCPSSKTETTFAGIGLGGYTKSFAGFVGTETYCYLGSAFYISYYAIGAVAYAATMTVAAGDQMHATILYQASSSWLTVILHDGTKGTTIAASASVPVGKHTDALWVDEPGRSSSGAILPLVDFGNVTFTKCTAAINGTASHALGFYSTTAIEMYNKANTAFKADITLITSNNKGFTVNWVSTGP